MIFASKIKEIFGTDRFNHLVIKRENDQVIYSATLTTDKEFSSTRLNEIIEDEIGLVFTAILGQCGVFDRNEEGRAQFKKFIASVK